MVREPRGWGIQRKNALCTKTGMVVYKRGKGDWVIDFPDGYHKYGRTSTAVLLSLFAFLAEGNSLKEARKKVGWK